MIRLRLQRRGRRKRPYFHIVAADQRSPRDGRVIERLGRYDNVSENKQLTLDEERVIHWLRVGAQPSDTVRSLLKREGIMYKLHLIRWGKSEEEIEAALEEWRSSRSSGDEEATSRKEQQKSLLEAEAKEYKKLLEEKAAQAAREAEAARLEAEKAEADAKEDESEEVEASTDEPAEEAKADVSEDPEDETPTTEEAEASTDEPAEEAKADVTDEPEEVEASNDEPAEEVKKEKEDTATAGNVSTDMNANEAIDHIKNTPLDQLDGFVSDAEERVTVQRAWESKKGEE
ncbi:MAG: 30S ribosomal protein S16 [Balneolaceae bacterium]